MKKGFTLVEILVVIAVLSIVGLLVLYIFTNSLRGSNKAQILSSIKKNGQAVLETMDKTIRSSDSVICIGSKSTTNDTLVVEQKDKYTRYRFIAPTPSANGKILRDFPLKPSPVPASNVRYSQEYLCLEDFSGQFLTDTDAQTGASVQNGIFTQSRSSGFKDTVQLKFQVTYPVNVSPALVGQIDPVDFATTIGLR